MSNLLGHGTIRLILLGLSDLNEDISLRIIKRVEVFEGDDTMLKRMYHVGLTPPRGDYYRAGGDIPYSPGSTASFFNLEAIFYGALFLDSHICFRQEISSKKWSFTSRDNSYILPKGPIMIQDVQITAYHPRQLSWRIDQAFQDLYIRNHITATDILEKRELFVDKQLNLIKIFEKLLWEQILTDPNIPVEKRFSLLYKFINEIRADLLNFEASGGLLEQFYNFLDSTKVSGYVTMRNGYKLHLDLSDFQGKDIMRWQGLSSTNFRRAFGDFKRYQFINPMSKDFIQSISNLILDVGGEVEVFPLWYANDKQGYRGFVNTPKQNIPNEFSVNIESEESQYILDFMGNLMLGYPVIYVVSEKGSTWNDNKMIFAFNQWGFVKLEDIYSVSVDSGGKGRVFNSRYPVSLSEVFPDPNNPGQYITFYDMFPDPISFIQTSFCEKYNDLWTLPPLGLTTGSHSEFELFYMSKIWTGTTDYDEAIRDLFLED